MACRNTRYGIFSVRRKSTSATPSWLSGWSPTSMPWRWSSPQRSWMFDCPNADVGSGRPNLLKKKVSTFLESASVQRSESWSGAPERIISPDDGCSIRATRALSSNDVTPPRVYQIPSPVSLISSTCKRPPPTSSITIIGGSVLMVAWSELEVSCFLSLSAWAETRPAAWTHTNRKSRVEARGFTKSVLL